jgi:hypothetical protein
MLEELVPFLSLPFLRRAAWRSTRTTPTYPVIPKKTHCCLYTSKTNRTSCTPSTGLANRPQAFHQPVHQVTLFANMNCFGRPRTAKRMADGLVAIDIFKFNKVGALGSEAASVMLNKVQVSIDWELANYGSARPWFICPTCGTRRRFLRLDGDHIGCTGCLGLTYASRCRRWAGARTLRRAVRLRRRLGIDEHPFALIPAKPRGWRTRPARSWAVLVAELMRCESEVLGAIGPAYAALMTARQP